MPVFFLFLRWILAAALLAAAWQLVSVEPDDEGGHRFLLAGLLFLVAAALLWSYVFRLATRPFFNLIDLVFLPGGRLERPMLNLKLPAHYIEQGRYEEALEEYTKILRHHPDEVEAYEKAIWLWAAVFKRSEKAAAVLRKAERRRLVIDEAMVRLARRGAVR